MKATLFPLLLFLLSHLYSQDLSGNWTGKLYQQGIGWYDFELLLTASGDGSYTGTSYISCDRGSGTMALRASLDDTGFHFKESRIRDEHWTTIGWYWCIKTGDLQLTQRDDSLVLSGHWQGSGTCKPGTLRVAIENHPVAVKTLVTKSELPARKVETKDNLQVGDDEVLVEIWDNEKEDGDIASITLNGDVVLKEHLVTIKKHQFPIVLQPGNNLLVLHAENLGTRPPNTAAITIYYDGKTKTVVLNSDKTKSEAIEIIH